MRQMIFYAMTEAEMFDPAITFRSLADIRASDPSVQVLENAWRLVPEGATRRDEECGLRCRLLGQVSEGGGCAMTRQRGGAVTRQTWAVDGVREGELLVALRTRFAYSNRDLGHPAYAAYLDGACDAAAEFPVAGVVWDELSNDFRIGSVDYFRHNIGLTAGCTDSVFEREDSMVTMGLLARAMAGLSPSGEAWNNSWGSRPTTEHLA
jgi:hypothetical protein